MGREDATIRTVRDRLTAESMTGCIGSKCNQWVPVIEKKHGAATWNHFFDPIKDKAGTFTPTGKGACCTNLRAIPWPDPATPEEVTK